MYIYMLYDRSKDFDSGLKNPGTEQLIYFYDLLSRSSLFTLENNMDTASIYIICILVYIAIVIVRRMVSAKRSIVGLVATVVLATCRFFCACW